MVLIRRKGLQKMVNSSPSLLMQKKVSLPFLIHSLVFLIENYAGFEWEY